MSWPALLSFVLLLLATYLMSTRRYVWDALLFAAVSLLVLVVAYVRGRRTPRWWWRWLTSFRLPSAPLAVVTQVAAMLVSAGVALLARAPVVDADYTPLFVAWLLALGSFVASLLLAAHRPPSSARCLRWTMSRREAVGLVVLLSGALVLRGVKLGTIPANLGGDEGTQLVAGLDLVAPPVGNPFATGWFSVPTMSFFVYGWTMRLLGATVAGGRALSAAVGTLTVLTSFLLARSVAGRRTGWIVAAIVAVSAYHVHYSRLASNQIFDPFLGSLTIWLLWQALGLGEGTPGCPEDSRKRAAWGATGVAAGLGWYAYFGARWVSFMVGLIVLWRWLREREFLRRHWQGLLLCAAGFLVAALPLLLWYADHPSAFTERYNAVSIFRSGWLEREVEITGRSALALLLQQAWKAATAFHLTPDPTFWYFPQRPLVDFVTGALLLLGMAEALLHLRWPSRGLSLIWFWSTLMMAWVVTENPPSSQRGLLLVPAVALFAAWGIEFIRRVFDLRGTLFRAVTAALLVTVAVLNIAFYFGTYTPERVYANPTAELATIFARYTQAHPMPVCTSADGEICPGRIYFMGPPYIYWDFGTLAFMLRNFPGQNVLPGEIPTEIQGSARFVAVPGRIRELEQVQARYPGGRLVELTNDAGDLMVMVYDWVP